MGPGSGPADPGPLGRRRQVIPRADRRGCHIEPGEGVGSSRVQAKGQTDPGDGMGQGDPAEFSVLHEFKVWLEPQRAAVPLAAAPHVAHRHLDVVIA
jgi:hypothetical protein